MQLEKDMDQICFSPIDKAADFHNKLFRGGVADYLVLDDTRKRACSVSQDFKTYKFDEKETKPDSIKCRFKTNRHLRAIKGTGNAITAAERMVIHKKLASNPLQF